MRTTRPVLAATLIMLLALTGCGSDEKEVKAERAVTDGIQAALAERADVLRAEVFYQDNFTASRVAAADIRVAAGTDPAPVADEVVRLLWLSDLAPLNSVTVDVTDESDLANSLVRRLAFEDAGTKADLEGRYGPRPVP